MLVWKRHADTKHAAVPLLIPLRELMAVPARSSYSRFFTGLLPRALQATRLFFCKTVVICTGRLSAFCSISGFAISMNAKYSQQGFLLYQEEVLS